MEKKFSDFYLMIQELFEPDFSSDFHFTESWSSMQSLMVVSAIDEHYDILISYDELNKVDTLEELYKLIVVKST